MAGFSTFSYPIPLLLPLFETAAMVEKKERLYHTRDPRKTTLYQLVEDHFENIEGSTKIATNAIGCLERHRPEDFIPLPRLWNTLTWLHSCQM